MENVCWFVRMDFMKEQQHLLVIRVWAVKPAKPQLVSVILVIPRRF